jgi:IS30 family transposase
MELTEEDLARLEEYAGLFLSVDEIAILLNVNVKDLRIELKRDNSEIGKRYFHAKLMSQLEIRRQVINFAKKGSPQAENSVREYMKKQVLSEK